MTHCLPSARRCMQSHSSTADEALVGDALAPLSERENLGLRFPPLVASGRQQCRDICERDGVFREVKRTGFAHLAAGAQQRPVSGPSQGATDAGTLDSERAEFVERQGGTCQTHDHVHWPIDGAHHRGDVLPGSQTWRIKYIGTGLLVCLQTTDGVAEVWSAHRRIATRFPRGGEALTKLKELAQRQGLGRVGRVSPLIR